MPSKDALRGMRAKDLVGPDHPGWGDQIVKMHAELFGHESTEIGTLFSKEVRDDPKYRYFERDRYHLLCELVTVAAMATLLYTYTNDLSDEYTRTRTWNADQGLRTEEGWVDTFWVIVQTHAGFGDYVMHVRRQWQRAYDARDFACSQESRTMEVVDIVWKVMVGQWTMASGEVGSFRGSCSAASSVVDTLTDLQAYAILGVLAALGNTLTNKDLAKTTVAKAALSNLMSAENATRAGVALTSVALTKFAIKATSVGWSALYYVIAQCAVYVRTLFLYGPKEMPSPLGSTWDVITFTGEAISALPSLSLSGIFTDVPSEEGRRKAFEVIRMGIPPVDIAWKDYVSALIDTYVRTDNKAGIAKNLAKHHRNRPAAAPAPAAPARPGKSPGAKSPAGGASTSAAEDFMDEEDWSS